MNLFKESKGYNEEVNDRFDLSDFTLNDSFFFTFELEIRLSSYDFFNRDSSLLDLAPKKLPLFNTEL